MTVKEKETDQDPTEREVSQKLALYTMPKLNLKDFPRGVGEKEDGVGLKKPQQIIDREDDYRKRRLNNYFSSEKRCFLPRKHDS
jgi:splicing factor 3B subunit 1